MRRTSLWTLLRSIFWTVPYIVGSVLILGLQALRDSRGSGAEQVLFRYGRRWSRGVLSACGARLIVEGEENLPQDGSYLFIANHRSNLDVPALLSALPFPVRFFAKSSLFQAPIFGKCLERGGHFVVDFDSAKASLQSMLNAAKVMREKRVSVLVFPEGNRALGEMEPFKEGAAFLAIKAQVPVVPIAIKGSREVLPPGSLHAAGGAIRLRVGQPISTKGLTAKDRAELTRRMEEAVGALLEGAPVHV